MNICQRRASAADVATGPILGEATFMSILLNSQKFYAPSELR